MTNKIKIVVNDGLINYGLTKEAYDQMGLDWEKSVVWTAERASPGYHGLLAGMAFKYDRANPKLVKCVEKLGEKAGVPGTYFIVREIEKGIRWQIVPRQLGGEDLITFLNKE